VTPFMPYLTRQSSTQAQAPVTAESKGREKKP